MIQVFSPKYIAVCVAGGRKHQGIPERQLTTNADFNRLPDEGNINNDNFEWGQLKVCNALGVPNKEKLRRNARHMHHAGQNNLVSVLRPM